MRTPFSQTFKIYLQVSDLVLSKTDELAIVAEINQLQHIPVVLNSVSRHRIHP